MSTSRSVDLQPFAPLVGLLKSKTNSAIKSLIIDVIPMMAFAPNLKKQQLIDQLIDYVRSSGSLAAVCRTALKGIKKDYLHMILLQYDLKATMKMRINAMIDQFISLNMPRKGLPDDEPCTAIVPYVAPCGARGADFPGQMVDFEKTNRKMRKTKKKLMKKWLKGASLIRRRLLSAAIVAELKRCLFPRGRRLQWTVESLRNHVSSVVGNSLHGGHALIFFHDKLQQLLPRKKRSKKKAQFDNRYCAVPKANFTVIADPVQFRELMAMRRQDRRA